MSELDGVDVLMVLYTFLGGDLVRTREVGDEVVHALHVPDVAADVLVGGPLDPGPAPSPECWVGAVVGSIVVATTSSARIAAAKEQVTGLHVLGGPGPDGAVRLVVRRDVDPATASVAHARRLAVAVVADAARARHLLERGPVPELDWGHGREVAGLLPDVERLWRQDLTLGGHHPDSFLPRAILDSAVTEARRCDRRHDAASGRLAWRVAASSWPVELTAVDLDAARRWLEARYPPECLHLDVVDDHVLAYGALGLVSFAVVDRYDTVAGIERLLEGSTGAATLIDAASDLITPVAADAAVVAELHMPHREFGWLRPFSVTASATGVTLARVWDPVTERLEDDDELSSACAQVARTPGDRAARDAVRSLAAGRWAAIAEHWR